LFCLFDCGHCTKKATEEVVLVAVRFAGAKIVYAVCVYNVQGVKC